MSKPAARLLLVVVPSFFVLACEDVRPASTSETPAVGQQTALTSLGSAAPFSVLAGSTVTNAGPTSLSGDLGVSPGTAITGFPPGQLTPPATFHAADTIAAQAQADLALAYDSLAAEACSSDMSGIDLGGQTLTPGVYCFSSEALVTGALVLDAQLDADARFVFKVSSKLTTGSNATLQLINGASPCNVTWLVGSSATVGTGTTFSGDIIALTSIALQSGATLSGRALARNGAVTLDNNQIQSAQCAEVAPGGAPVDAGMIAIDAGLEEAPDAGTNIYQDAGVQEVPDAGLPAPEDAGTATDAGTPAGCCEGTASCGGACVDLQTDCQNCGACGVTCHGGEVCTAGSCGPPCAG